MKYARKSTKRVFKRRPRRRFNITRSKKPYQSKFVRMTRWSTKDTTSNVHVRLAGSASGNPVLGSTQFRLNDTPNFTEIVSLFDNYTIRKVLYRWVISRNPDYGGIGGVFPRLSWVHDFNDSIPISRALMQQHPRMREVFFSENYQKTRWYSLKPASLATIFEGTTASAYKPSWGQFVDTNDADMPHYGIKYVVDQLYTGIDMYLEAKIILDVKGIS